MMIEMPMMGQFGVGMNGNNFQRKGMMQEDFKFNMENVEGDNNSARPELPENGDFKFSRGMKGEKPEEMTEEEKEAKLEEIKAELASKLEAEEITQEEYDEMLAALESGKFKSGKMGFRGMRRTKGKALVQEENTEDITEE